MQDVPAYALHTKVKAEPANIPKLLTGAWDQMSALSEHLEMPELEDPELAVTLYRYCLTLMEKQHAHDAGLLWEMLTRQGFLNGES
jgi:hypothetical protein